MSYLRHLLSDVLGPILHLGRPQQLCPGGRRDLALWAEARGPKVARRPALHGIRVGGGAQLVWNQEICQGTGNKDFVTVYFDTNVFLYSFTRQTC